MVARDGFISARSIKGEYACLDNRDRLTLYGGKDGKFEYQAGAELVAGTYYADDNEGVDLTLRLAFPAGEQTATVNLKNKTFPAFVVAAPPTRPAKKLQRVAPIACSLCAGPPAPDAAAWTRYVHEGHAYWHNAATNESRWEDP